MNHRKSGRILSRNRNQRRALFRTLIGSLVMHGRIETTLAKAKEVKNMIDPIVNRAKRGSIDAGKRVAAIRELSKSLPEGAVRTLVSPEFVARFSDRPSGYTRVVKLGARKGDGAEMAVIEFVA
ncbi:MAG: 50S ribosomal protein L17 [Candidatus Moranbacteria bacterium]|nr:50S ribosomal protein L17 [Candidatus Moranbacteria bacterium]NTW46219.1 50S ribosomal protein L17 [Candidatus Moranbacteria bacterium]